jgi:transketolase
MNTKTLAQAANEARGLAMDAVHACNSGHLGLPLGCAEIGAVLFGESMRYYPDAPKWLNRDRFVLSAGHGSMFLYGWLHLSGYAVSRDDVKKFRALHSITPGHPEFHETPGVEATTGPLGQGIGNAVGYAMSAKRAAALFNTPEHTIFDQHIFCINGDGCLQEGVAKEAIAFAGHNGLDNLILIYDSNDVTLDAMAVFTQGEDAEQYFTSQRWDVATIDGHNIAAIAAAIETAKENKNGRPKVIIAKTLIGKGIPEVAVRSSSTRLAPVSDFRPTSTSSFPRKPRSFSRRKRKLPRPSSRHGRRLTTRGPRQIQTLLPNSPPVWRCRCRLT